MPTTITHAAQGITYVWTLNLDNVSSGVFWDGTPYVIAQPGLKVTNVQITSTLNGAELVEGPCLKQYHALGAYTNGTLFYGHLYLNGFVKNPKPLMDTAPNGADRLNKGIFDSRSFGVFNKGWTTKTKSTDSNASYAHFDVNAFMATKAVFDSGAGFDAAANDVFMIAKSNYDPNDPGTFTMSNSSGYPYQKHRNRSNVLGYGILFVLAAHPAGGGANYFRPPVFWPEEDLANRPLYALSNIVSNRIPSGAELTPTIAGSSYNRPPNYNNNTFVEFCYGFPIGSGITYSHFLPLYPAYGANTPGHAYGAYYQSPLLQRLTALYADASGTSLTPANRLKALRVLVQWGLDAFGSIKSFGRTSSGAGQRPCTARPWSIIAGWFLNNEDMRAPETTMLYGSYANRLTGTITPRALSIINSYDGSAIRTLRGVRPAAIGGTDGYTLSQAQWAKEVYGDKNTLKGKKRRLALVTSLESVCYHKVSGDINESRVLYYANIGRTRCRTFGAGVLNSPPVIAANMNPATESARFDNPRPNSFTGNLAYLRWTTNPFPTGWVFSHDGKGPTIDFSYIRVIEDSGSNTSTTQYYRILKCAGDFRLSDPVGGTYTLYLDRPWVGGVPSAAAKYEMVPCIPSDAGDIMYIIQTGFAESNSAFIDANLNPYTIYGGICYPIVFTLYSWMQYIKRDKNGGLPVDLDEDSTNVHEFLNQITRKMPYTFQDYNFYWRTGSNPWEQVVYGKWLNLKDPPTYTYSGVAYDKGAAGWQNGAPGVQIWNGVNISSLNFSPINPPVQQTAPPEPEVESDTSLGGETDDNSAGAVAPPVVGITPIQPPVIITSPIIETGSPTPTSPPSINSSIRSEFSSINYFITGNPSSGRKPVDAATGQPFTDLQVFYDGLGQTSISWILDTRFDDPFPHQFELQFARAPVAFDAGEYQVLTQGTDVTYLEDTVLRSISTTGFAYYRIKLTTPAGVYYSSIKGLGGNVSSANIPIFKEILRKEKLALRKDRGGTIGYLFKRRYYGPRCSCADKNTGTMIAHACPNCAGTGFKFGYFPGVEFPILISTPENRTTTTGPTGTTDIKAIAARCLAFPAIDVKDIWLEQDTSRVFEVFSTTIASRYSMEALAANIQLRELSMADAVSLLISSTKLQTTFNSVKSSNSIILPEAGTLKNHPNNPFRR